MGVKGSAGNGADSHAVLWNAADGEGWKCRKLDFAWNHLACRMSSVLHGHYAGTGLCRNGGGVKRCCKEELENSPVWNVGLCALHHTGMLL